MKKNNYAIIMAGGIGSRFWPISTSRLPKQFLDILGTGETLLQQTFRRLSKICSSSQILIVTNIDYKDICLSQLPDIKADNVLCEPSRRNTAPCIAYASFKIKSKNKNANIIVSPSDHLITDESKFNRIIRECLKISEKNTCLITLGIKPSRAETGYGYIQFSDESYQNNSRLKKVRKFVEKPSLDIAREFLKSGDFLWNSGMFVWSVESILSAFREFLPDMYEIFSEGDDFYNTSREEKFINEIFTRCKNISVDYAIMEKSKNVFVFPSDFGWSDLGTWSSLNNHVITDENSNTVSKQVFLYNAKNNFVKVSKDKACVIEGLDGYIIVDTSNALLICRKEEEQRIKEFVKDIKSNFGKDVD